MSNPILPQKIKPLPGKVQLLCLSTCFSLLCNICCSTFLCCATFGFNSAVHSPPLLHCCCLPLLCCSAGLYCCCLALPYAATFYAPLCSWLSPSTSSNVNVQCTVSTSSNVNAPPLPPPRLPSTLHTLLSLTSCMQPEMAS